MTTALSLINQALLNIGERQVTSLTTPTAQLAFNSLLEALRDIETIHRWEWLYDTIPAVSWTNEVADLGSIQQLHSVSVGDSSTGYRQLEYVKPQDFDVLPLSTGTPRYYTQTGYGEYKLNPYPVSSTDRAKVRFYVTRSIPLPVLETDDVQAPQRFDQLIIKRLSYLLALRHLDDAQTAAQFNGEFESLTQRYRDRERKVPTTKPSMYRRR